MDSLSSSSIFLEDFGQKVDLTRRIREVLLNYPEGTTLLKELIQNADDAGATSVRFCLDRRHHGSDSLLSRSLAQWQGPALLSFNDAVFTEEDFVSISRIGGSRKHGQAWKTGRFGVGFNSVYHLTDLPSFVSGKYVVLFDPHGFYLPNVSSANPGKRIEYVSSSAISLYKDQFFPYCAFGCDMKTPFAGTLFRFPLRNADQAEKSKLSRQTYSEDDVSSMFAQLHGEGVFALLFLKSVLSVEMYSWDAGESEPRKLYSCSVSSATDETIWHRQALLRLSKLPISNESEMDAYSVDFSIEAMIGDKIEKKINTFYVVQTMASTSSRIGAFAAKASKDFDIHLLPWASVAACISDDTSVNDVLKLGRAFCFLPLPVRTGLTVQVNGYFEVSSNRRGIWYGGDMDRSGKIRSIWNRLLLEDVVAPCFGKLMVGVQGLLGPSNSYYSLWPSGAFEEPWNVLVEHIYRNIGNGSVLYSDFGGGKWVSPVEAFLCDEEFTKRKELAEALVQLEMPVVHLPNPLFNMFLKYACGFQQKVVTPETVRCFLRRCKILTALSRSYKLILLEYCLEDLLDADVGTHANNLTLLPLANGSFGMFYEASTGLSYFVCNELESSLLHKVSDRLIDRNIPLNILSRLSAIAKSAKANLIFFNVQYFLQFFPRFVPVDWKYKDKVLWDPEYCHDHPTSSWFVLFWQYLQNQCEKLSLFGDWPILPSVSGHLYRASRLSKLIYAEKLSHAMREILVKVGCKILDSNFGIEHSDLSQYVHDADYAGVLESIFDAFSSNGTSQIFLENLRTEQRDELRRFLLDSKWYMRDCINDSNLRNCKRLPIYRVYGGGSTQAFQFSDLENPQKYLPPLDVPEGLLGGEFIISTIGTEEDILLKYYGIERMGRACFYRQQVFCRIRELQPEIRNRVMLSILKTLPQLCVEDASFRECLKNLEFVPTLSGVVKCPAVLYDPRNEELCALLEVSDSFPCGAFQESDILDMLQGLGLKTSVSLETVIESARKVEQIMHDDPERAHLRGKVLLSYLEVNAMKWLPDQLNDDKGTVNRMFSRAATAFRPRNLKSDLDRFWSDLRMICWCPVLVSAPFECLPWPVVSSTVAPPKLVRLQEDLWLVSASMRILDGACSSTALSYNLGWLSSPGGSAIAAQLLELGKNNEIVNDQVLRQELALAMPKIYSILTSLIGSDEMDIVKAVLEGCRWIWVGDGFTTSDEVVLDGPFHLAPYIRVIPIDLAVFKELFLELGIREFLKPTDYTNILCRMAMKKGSCPLDLQEMRAAILIGQHLAEIQFHEQVKIYLPDVLGRLFPASDLVYNDAPWLLGSDDFHSSINDASTVVFNAKKASQKLVHGNISNEVAEKLGVCSLRRILLAESADSMNLSLSGAAEAFGQHEALTTRLKHILEMYADGPGILFELVQNAEDAGASQVVFLLDKTQYGTSSLLSPEMADWQGPALYSFNDSVFSPQDLYAISRIGQESKLEKPLAIGRFGLGFNCVYHFTDVPTFVSGENIVMFDPHACNLPGISPSHPGLRIKFVGRKILEQFPDQFSPFLHFGCDLQHSFPGTLFRFPLRSASLASRSQIKKEGYVPEDVLSLFASFSDVVSDALVFLHNVKTISIFVKEGTGSEMQLVHHVHRSCITDPGTESGVLHDIFSLIDRKQHKEMDKNQLLKKLSKSINRDLPYKYQQIVVTEKSSSGGISHYWMTGECLGGGRTKNNPAVAGKCFNSIPWASVAAYIHSVEVGGESSNAPNTEDTGAADIFQVSLGTIQKRENFDGRAFCFLPLPISTGLPAHVNAYFELSSNRRDIWFGNDMAGGGKKRSDWNIYLLEDVVAPAYARLLETIASQIGPCDLFFSFWPTTIGLEPWASLVRKLYLFIADHGLRVLYTKARGGQWVSTKQAIFPDFTFYKTHELLESLSDAGLPLVPVSKLVVERFMDVCPSLHFLTPTLLRTLLIRRKRGFKDRNAMVLTLEYCLFDCEIPVRPDNLYGLPLLPLADGSFTMFEKIGAGERIYIVRGDEYGLLKDSLSNQLVDSGIPEDVHVKLCDIAQNGESNISFLSCHLLEKLFIKLLPVEWQCVKKVTWSPGHQNQPSLEWIRLLWRYLKSSCEDLSIFSKWPILPVADNYLFQLSENSHVIKDDGWSENMSSLLLKVGCLFLNRHLPIEHPQLERYVQPPTATGLLNAFLAIAGTPENIEELFCDASEAELHELRSFILQSKWFFEEQMSDTQIDTIKHLPVFESYRSRTLVSLSKPIKWLKPDGVRDDLLHEDFVRTESEREKIILRRYLDIREPSKVEFYRVYVFSRMSEFCSQQGALPAILHDVKLLIEEDGAIKSALAMTSFVLAANGSWQAPSRLYDPRVPELRKLLHVEVFFPSDQFSDPETLDTLVSLGLKRTLGFPGLLDCARSVSMFHDSRDSEAIDYGRRLLKCMDTLALKLSTKKGESSNAEMLNAMFIQNNDVGDTPCVDTSVTEGDGDTKCVDTLLREENHSEGDLDFAYVVDNLIDDKPGENFWSEMKAIPWCPVCADPLVLVLPWLKSSNQVASPSNVRPKSQMWLVSSTMHVLDGECGSMYLQHKLGWMDGISIDVLSTQLIELSKSCGQLKVHSLRETGFDTVLQKGIPTLYSKLQEYIGTDEFMVLKSALDGVAWVWTGDEFVSPFALTFDSPVKFTPYLYVVPAELSEFRELLLELGVRLSFDIWDYVHVLQRLQNDVKGVPLSTDQLSFVRCVLEAVADCFSEKPLFEASNALLIPDSSGVLMCAGDLVYNDAPWIEDNLVEKHFVHPYISNDLADRLGVKSIRCLSLVDEGMTKDIPCMDFARINELLACYGSNDFLLFDLLELADCCKAKKLHLYFDKREHHRQSLLQHNLGEFQGPALVAVLEGAILGREEISSLQLLPPWRLRGDILNYGLGLLSCYFICDFLSIVSGGYLYMFDPRGLALAVSSSHNPAAKVFSLLGTNLTERFRDQFNPMLIGENMPWSSLDSTVIRMPLSSESLKDGLDLGLKRVKQIIDRFLEHASRSLIFLKSVLQVSFSTWEEGTREPCQDYMVCVDPSSAIMRNPFSEKKWRKFQISRLFSSSNAAIKLHIVDVNLYQGGTTAVDKWLVALSLGSGQTRNMALDRRYLAYNLTPVAGVAALISRDGLPADAHETSSIMSPLPLSCDINLPITVLGCFLVQHNFGRYLFKHQDKGALFEARPEAGDHLIEAWNRELMSCVRDSYIELVVEIQKLCREPSISIVESSAGRAIPLSLKVYVNQIYSFWPKSICHAPVNEPGEDSNLISDKMLKEDRACLVEQVIRPFYIRLVDLPVWQLYSGNFVKAEEGMFLSQPGNGVGGNLLPATVCSFVKEHYQVFSVPWELVTEIKAAGVRVREIKPKMVRDLLRVTSTSIVLRSVDTYVDVLEYCLSDIQFLESSNYSRDDASLDPVDSNTVGGAHNEVGSSSASVSTPQACSSHGLSSQSSVDAIDMMTSLGKALFDFGRVVVEDIGRGGGPILKRNSIASGSNISNRNIGPKLLSIAAELKALPCPTATNHLARLGVTELWIGNKEQQALMMSLAEKFIHPKVFERAILANVFSKPVLQSLLKLKLFSFHLLASHMRSLFNNNWVEYVMESNMAPWFSWENTSSFGGEGGPSSEWIKLFWKSFSGSLEDLSLFSDWPLVPAFLGRSILCRVRERHLLFIPPPLSDPVPGNGVTNVDPPGSNLTGLSMNHTSELIQPYITAFEVAKRRYPWLLSLLNQCNIPVFDTAFMDCAAPCDCIPTPSQSLGQVIASKLVAAKHAGYFPELSSLSASDQDELFTLFAHDFFSNGSKYGTEELEVLRSLPIYRTVVGSCTRLNGQEQCVISSNSFLKPYDEHCLNYSADSIEFVLLRALGVVELHDKQILIRFGLPGYEGKPTSEQEDILIYLYTNWQDLQADSSVVEVLKKTKFVRNSDEFTADLYKPKDLYDPSDAILKSVFSGERKKFPGERFGTDGWLRILRKTGLRTSTEADVILECAKRVEFLGYESMKSRGDFDEFETDLIHSRNEVSMEILVLAGSVVEAVFSNFAILYGNNFCNQFGKIACIPAELGLPNVYGKQAGKRVLTSYNEAIISRDWPLAWSCAPILSRQNVVPPEYSWGALQLRSPPTFSTVLRHLQVIGKNGGEDTLAHWPITSGMMTIDEACCEILKYLDKTWGSLSLSDITELRRVAFLPVANGTRLVTVNCLFVHLSVNLSPFAFELPTLYLPYVKILKDLGLQDMLSVASAKDLLLNLQKASGYQRLNPNELRAVLEILHFVCFATDANMSDWLDWESDAIVPDDGCRLVHAKLCVYIDSYGSRYVKCIETSRLRFVHPDLPERICIALGIKKLSEVVVEELNHEEHIRYLDRIGSFSLADIREKLLSRSFQDAVWSLVNSLACYVPAINNLTLGTIQSSLETVAKKLQFVKCLHTRFLLLPKSVDITLVAKDPLIPVCDDGFEHQTLYFLNLSKTRILVAEPPGYISVLDIIAIVVSQVLGSPIPLPVGSLFFCPEGSDTAVVDMLKLSSSKRDTKAMSNSLVGKEILSKDALQVQFHPLRPFYRGEIVAFRTQNGEKLKYGKVPEDVRPSAGQALYRFKVETAPGVTESILSSQVFSFRSMLGNEASTSTIPEDIDAVADNIAHDKVPETSTRGKTKTSQVRASDLPQPSKELQYGRVSAAELVQAVHEMLSAAGVSMAVETQSLLQKTITLQEQLEVSQAALLLEQERSDMATKEADTVKAAWVCRVCLSNEVDMTIVPCGHVLCRRCSSAVSKCPFCRLQVKKTIRIFRP